ncbi:MAG: hypothetical protein QNJ74_04580 [Trichodesmium sp. MO_231.B1]|nr:hypothetical protein [Trichodesmium sp. MO_231.B1]
MPSQEKDFQIVVHSNGIGSVGGLGSVGSVGSIGKRESQSFYYRRGNY